VRFDASESEPHLFRDTTGLTIRPGRRQATALALHYGLIMSLEIRESIREGIVVLSLKGRLTVGESNSIRDKVNECAAAGHVNVILDLTDIDYVDSTGLGTMVICFTSLKKQGGALKLVNPNKRNVELLLLTKLHTVFQVFTEAQDAVNSFFPGREIKHFDILQFVKEQEREEEEEAEKTSKPK
jgi:anti-sigma B factor antagonist